jgi:hypothetical protein
VLALGEASLPPLPENYDVRALASEMAAERQIAGLPRSDDVALEIPASARGDAVRAAFDAIGPMFWRQRVSFEDACTAIRAWVRRHFE